MRQTFLRLVHFIRKAAIPDEYDAVLSHYSEYYRSLHPQLKRVFRYRLFCLLKVLKFESSSGFNILPEMKILIGAAQIKLTFGLKRFMLSKYKKIDVVPHEYTYDGYEQFRFAGDVNVMHKIITLSWKHLEEGFIIPDDAMNLALHEMSHCLSFEDREGSLWGRFLDIMKFREWQNHSEKEFYKIREGEESFIREYGGTNMYEMFAVSVEAFFEKPAEFKKHLPKKYHMLAELLNQDPLDSENPILRRRQANHYT